MARQCAFCTEKATTKEHCIPKWMARRTGLDGAFLENTEAFGPGRVVRRHPVSFKSHRARLMCGDCQVHFKHLEDAVIPIYDRLERPEATTLNAEQQSILARWTLKTAICCLFADAMETIPDSDRYLFRRTGALPAGAWIAFGRWDGVARMSTDQFAVGSPDNPTPDAYGFMLATRRVVTKCVVFYVKSGDPVENLFPTQLVQAWPPKEGSPFVWPPSAVWDDFDVLRNYVPLTAPLSLSRSESRPATASG